MTITRSDFCPGHGGECDAYDPEMGCGHPYDYDHGTTAYCDGTCQDARDAFEAELDRIVRYLPGFVHGTVVLDVNGHGYTPESYRVTFEGRDAEAWALAYMAARPGYYFHEVPCAPISRTHKALLAKLYPTCEHGMSAWLCEGPEHFMSADQERAYGW